MKANELRIGNWFFNGKFNQQVSPTHLDYLLNKNFYPHDAMKPIPLTPEILVKAGFVKRNGINGLCYVLYLGKFAIHASIDLKEWFIYISFISEIKSLHNLQNLVHSLTGEELNISL
jgi:hypothetical protein